MGGLQSAHSSVVGDALKAGFQNFVDQSATRVATTVAGTPAAGYFYSSIVGRAPIPDISNDLRVPLGIERIMTQSIMQLQNEFGPNGEPVYAALNDDRGLVRFVGDWKVGQWPFYGQNIYSNTPSTYIEIVFYGTGLNILVGDSNTLYATIDGGVESATNVGMTGNNPIVGRGYAPNSIANVVNNLTLGIHTVKLRLPTTDDTLFNGFEILNSNASGLINVNPGVGYNNGQKVTKSISSSVAYKPAALTGTRGGRVVQYLNADGTVGQAVTAVNAAAAYLASADHTNEEVARTYHWREFGAGRADDFSSDGSAVSRMFTLDDGTTTLTGSGLILSGAIIYGVSATPTLTFTFIGTGLDIQLVNTTSGIQIISSIKIDGTSVGSYSKSGNFSTYMYKICSGLPYGTHTVSLSTDNSSTMVGISKFAVYGPKKPTIPTTALELCDYNVMADYILNSTTGTSGTTSSGVMRKFATRENVYVGTWNSISTDPAFLCGFAVSAQTSGAYAEYTFFGTGVNLKMYLGNSAQNYTFSIDGSSNLSSYTSAFNYTGSGLTYTNTTGTVSGTSSGAIGYNGAVFSLSGLPLGIHKIRFTLNNTTTTYIDAIDIITPIHSNKSNLFADLQNTLTVGSNSLMDSRKVSPINGDRPSQKAWAQAVGVTPDPTTTAAWPTLVPMPDMSVTIKTSGGSLDIAYVFVCSANAAAANNNIVARIYVDGQAMGSIKYSAVFFASGNVIISDTLIVPVSPGMHKVDVYWCKDGTITTITGSDIRRNLTVKEL